MKTRTVRVPAMPNTSYADLQYSRITLPAAPWDEDAEERQPAEIRAVPKGVTA